jgi:hypothetical protein
MAARENGEIVEALLLKNQTLNDALLESKKELERVSGTYSFNLYEQSVENRIAIEAAKAAEEAAEATKASENKALLEAKLLKMENDAFKAQITSLRSELKVTLGAHDFAVLKINEIQAERDSARAHLSDVTRNSILLNYELDGEVKAKNEFAAMHKDVSKKYHILQEDNEALGDKFESLQEDNEALGDKFDSLQTKFDSLQAELMAYKVMLNDVLSARN